MFDSGVVVFFRAFAPNDSNLARSVHLDGRAVVAGADDTYHGDYTITNEHGDILGIYPRDWVAAIMPLQTTGPADASDQQTGRDSTPASTEGDPKGKPGRTKRINPH